MGPPRNHDCVGRGGAKPAPEPDRKGGRGKAASATTSGGGSQEPSPVGHGGHAGRG